MTECLILAKGCEKSYNLFMGTEGAFVEKTAFLCKKSLQLSLTLFDPPLRYAGSMVQLNHS